VQTVRYKQKAGKMTKTVYLNQSEVKMIAKKTLYCKGSLPESLRQTHSNALNLIAGFSTIKEDVPVNNIIAILPNDLQKECLNYIRNWMPEADISNSAKFNLHIDLEGYVDHVSFTW
jgi:hypothetical protein